MANEDKAREETVTRFTLGGDAGAVVMKFFQAGTDLLETLKAKIELDMKNNAEVARLKGQVDLLQRKVQSLDSRVGRKTPHPVKTGVKNELQGDTKPHEKEVAIPLTHDAVLVKRPDPKAPLTQRPFEAALKGAEAVK